MSVEERLDICSQALLDNLLKVLKKKTEFCTRTQSPYQTIFEFRPCIKD